jgi:hypothetical protein
MALAETSGKISAKALGGALPHDALLERLSAPGSTAP